jgi:hypothetical protein
LPVKARDAPPIVYSADFPLTMIWGYLVELARSGSRIGQELLLQTGTSFDSHANVKAGPPLQKGHGNLNRAFT